VNIEFDKSFDKSLDKIKNKTLYAKVEKLILELEKSDSIKILPT
jgi:mRNA interferase RelE/StbE